MREKTLYARLAWTGMRKNRRLYLPYLLSCAGMVLMFYILMGLSGSPVLEHMSGGGSSTIILRLGTVVIAVFALIFLFYTHSFLIRRREREFGLYNVLGMGKGNIARILLWETVITYGLTTGTGLLLGMVLYKLAELGMVRLLQVPVTYTLTVSVSSLLAAAALFAAIHTLILLNSLRQLHGVSAVGLLRSESVGEKPPKAQWVLTAAGMVLLGAAYALSLSIKEPLAALLWFFAAVIMVILATYLLFISGSVTLCRGLQRNKKYYYRPQHFVSVSSMAYRMKRNGAGLASVCILATMVLVMISSTTCLYVGQEDAVNARYPRDMDVAVYGRSDHPLDEAEAEQLRQGVESTVFNFGGQTSNVATYREISVSGLPDGGDLRLGNVGASAADSTRVTQLHFLPLAGGLQRCHGAEPDAERRAGVCGGSADGFPLRHPDRRRGMDVPGHGSGHSAAERPLHGGYHPDPYGGHTALHTVRAGAGGRTEREVRLVSHGHVALRLRHRSAGKPAGEHRWHNAQSGGRAERLSGGRQR
mgnify:CR=1 FL=1